MIIQHFNLNLIPESAPVVVHADQYDHGTDRLVIKLYNGDEPYSPVGSVMIQGTKPDGKGFAYTATLDGNTVTADLTEQMTAVSGDVRTQIVVTEESGRTGTFAFILNIQTSALPDGSDMSKSEIAVLEELVESAEQSSSDAEAWAVGTRGGVPVGPEDPAYHNSSEYWAQQSHGDAGVTSFNMRSGSVLPITGDYDSNQIRLSSILHIGGETQEDVQEALEALSQHGGGIFPYLYIDSEPGSTVTVTTPTGGTITPTAAGSGHWECEVPSYGIYVIHSVLAGQGDATLSLTVDDVKEYHVTDSHYDFTINITADVGSSIRVEAGAETYTGTGTGSPVAFVVHQASTQYTVTETLDGYTDVKTVTSASVTGGSVNVTLHVFAATLSISTNSSELFGQVIVISKSGTIVGSTSFTDSGQASYVVHETGTFTLTCTYQGQSYSEDVPVSAETTYPVVIDTIPEGSTVLPTDDIQTWLKCAEIDKAYTTLSEVLADHDTLYLLMGSNNAVDYLVRSTTWASGITADEYAMKYIGKWNYASDTLLDDSTWLTAICASTYFTSVLNDSLPTMTGQDAPTGYHATGTMAETGKYAFYAFDGNDSTYAVFAQNAYLRIQLPSAITAKKLHLYIGNNGQTRKLILQGSNDGSVWDNLKSMEIVNSTSGNINYDVDVDNDTAYTYYQLLPNGYTGGAGNTTIYTMQLYDRQDVTEGIDVYGAASDTMTVTGNGITLTITTDSSGHYIVPKTSLPNGTYTFTSGVAKDPTNLSNDYSKSITISDGTAEVYVCPTTVEKMLYWYGNLFGREWTTSGWKNDGASVTGTVSYSAYYVTASIPQNNGVIWGTDNINSDGITKAHFIGSTTQSTKNTGILRSTSKTITSPWSSASLSSSISSTTKYISADFNSTLSGSVYYAFRAWNQDSANRTATIYAMWIE